MNKYCVRVFTEESIALRIEAKTVEEANEKAIAMISSIEGPKYEVEHTYEYLNSEVQECLKEE